MKKKKDIENWMREGSCAKLLGNVETKKHKKKSVIVNKEKWGKLTKFDLPENYYMCILFLPHPPPHRYGNGEHRERRGWGQGMKGRGR